MIGDIVSVVSYGIIFGSVYTLLAMGFTLAYGVGKILNLAHGAFYLIAGYFLYMFIKELEYSITLAIILVILIMLIIGALTYIFLIKPLQDNEIAVLIVTFALGFFLEQLVIVFWGSESHQVLPFIEGYFPIYGVKILYQSFFLILFTIVVVIALSIFIKKSKMGKSIRAVSQDREAAMLSGINANRVIMYTLIISALLVGFAAIWRIPGSSLEPQLGWSKLTSAFAVVILGGLGSIRGSVLAAYIIGLSESIVNKFIGESYTSLIPIIIILIVLIVRPRGLFGKKEVK